MLSKLTESQVETTELNTVNPMRKVPPLAPRSSFKGTGGKVSRLTVSTSRMQLLDADVVHVTHHFCLTFKRVHHSPFSSSPSSHNRG